MALSGRFELNCPQAPGSVLSSETVQPAINAPLLRGPERAEYAVGVSGCNQRQTYVVIRPQDGSNNCFAARATARDRQIRAQVQLMSPK